MTTESKSPQPSPLYKRPREHNGRTYYFYSNTRVGLLIYAANRKDGEKSNPVIVVDEYGGILAKGELREFRRFIE